MREQLREDIVNKKLEDYLLNQSSVAHTPNELRKIILHDILPNM